jgi:hypothetical protein
MAEAQERRDFAAIADLLASLTSTYPEARLQAVAAESVKRIVGCR